MPSFVSTRWIQKPSRPASLDRDDRMGSARSWLGFSPAASKRERTDRRCYLAAIGHFDIFSPILGNSDVNNPDRTGDFHRHVSRAPNLAAVLTATAKLFLQLGCNPLLAHAAPRVRHRGAGERPEELLAARVLQDRFSIQRAYGTSCDRLKVCLRMASPAISGSAAAAFRARRNRRRRSALPAPANR